MTKKYIAYTYTWCGLQPVQSAAHDTREAAAKELFEKLPQINDTVETTVAVEQFGRWRNYGIGIELIKRSDVMG